MKIEKQIKKLMESGFIEKLAKAQTEEVIKLRKLERDEAREERLAFLKFKRNKTPDTSGFDKKYQEEIEFLEFLGYGKKDEVKRACALFMSSSTGMTCDNCGKHASEHVNYG